MLQGWAGTRSAEGLSRASGPMHNQSKSRRNTRKHRTIGSSPNPVKVPRMFSPNWMRKDKASRSKSIAEVNVGSLLCVDRLGTSFMRPRGDVDERVKAFLGTRRRSTSFGRATSSDGALRQIVSGWGPSRSFLGRGQHRALRPRPWRGVSVSLLRLRHQFFSASFRDSAMKWPQGASPVRLVSTAGEGPVLCFQRLRLHRSF
jgi:hypothetical protein